MRTALIGVTGQTDDKPYRQARCAADQLSHLALAVAFELAVNYMGRGSAGQRAGGILLIVTCCVKLDKAHQHNGPYDPSDLANWILNPTS